MSTFTMRTLAILPLLALTTLAQAFPSHAASALDGDMTILPGLSGPPTAALTLDGMPSTGQHMLGYTPSEAALNSVATNAMPSTAALPASVDLSQYDPPVGNQGGLESCVSWTTGYDMRGWYARRDGYYPPAGNGRPDGFAPMYLYSQVKGLNPDGTDTGSRFPNNLYVLQHQGIETRADYSHGDYDYTDQPTTAEQVNAANFTIMSYKDVTGSNLQYWIETTIAGGNPVGIAIPVYPEFDQVSDNTSWVVGTPTAAEVQAGSRGGHAIFAVAYDQNGLWIENSWGTGWGRNGYAELSWDFVNTYAFEAVNEAPAPKPAGVYDYTGSPMSWPRIGGPAGSIYAGGGSLYATYPATGDIYGYDSASGQWTQVGGPGKQFAVDGQGTLYGLTPDGSAVYRYTGSPMSWTQIGGAAGSIYAGGSGLYATYPTTGDLFGYDSASGQWTHVGGPGKQFAVDGQGTLYGLLPDGSGVYRYTGTPMSWTRIGGPADSIYAGGGSLYATYPTTGDIYGYDSGTSQWTQVGGPGKQFAVDGQGTLYGLLPDGSGVYRYTGTPMSWTRIGGPAGMMAAGASQLYTTAS